MVLYQCYLKTLLETKIEIENLLNCVDSIFCKIIIEYYIISIQVNEDGLMGKYCEGSIG